MGHRLAPRRLGSVIGGRSADAADPLVVVGQACGAVFLGIRMFEVVIHTPELIVLHALSLLYTITVAGLLLLPAPSRAFFRLG